MLIKTECIRGRTFTTRAEANLALFEYIDGFTTPGASRNGSVTSAPVEEKHYADQATAERTDLKPRQPVLAS
nr:IS3 family transposase [Streptomyces dysideae]